MKQAGAIAGAICAALALGAAGAQTAYASFPGGDGVFATDDSDGSCTGSCADSGGPGDQVSTVDPQTGVATAITSPTSTSRRLSRGGRRRDSSSCSSSSGSRSTTSS